MAGTRRHAQPNTGDRFETFEKSGYVALPWDGGDSAV
jgi:hypothetical protein